MTSSSTRGRGADLHRPVRIADSLASFLPLPDRVRTRLRARRRSAPTALPRLLVHVVHYFGGPSSEFVGRSTRSDPADRRAKVQRVLHALHDLPYDTEVVVCGIPSRALVPIDLDLSGDVEDPRHLVYAAIEDLASRVDDAFDYFMCIEDDILVSHDALDRMMRFTDRSGLNEVLLPNRIEFSPHGVQACMDLTVMPGWRGMRRRFEGQRLDVAENPHSGLALLRRDQLVYARRRVNFSRRQQFVGGPMASAFANLHQPFLLWRTRRDPTAHSVTHLDRWALPPGVSIPVPGETEEVLPGGARGRIDEFRFDGVVARVRGWLATPSGEPAEIIKVRLGDQAVADPRVAVQQRADVRRRIPGVAVDCGFEISFSLLGVAEGAVVAKDVTLEGEGAVIRALWPGGPASVARESAPEVPESPDMGDQARARLHALMVEAHCYLEYGIGGSTVLAASLGVPASYCVDSDASWLATVKSKLSEVSSAASRQFLIHADIGPTRERGYPRALPTGPAAGDYALAVWNRLQADGMSPDLVLVAGRYRVASFLATLLHAQPGTRILFDDYFDRPHHAAVHEVITPTAQHDGVAEFVVPELVDREHAWRLMVQYAGDPR